MRRVFFGLLAILSLVTCSGAFAGDMANANSNGTCKSRQEIIPWVQLTLTTGIGWLTVKAARLTHNGLGLIGFFLPSWAV